MIIQNLNHEFKVKQILQDNSQFKIYLCQYYAANKLQMCEIIQLKHLGGNRLVISYFNGIILDGLWEDFMECFINEESLYVVVKFHEGIKLAERLSKEKFSLQERAMIFERICERAVLQNAPNYLLWNGLQKKHLIVDNRLNVFMQYDLAEVQKHYQYTMKEVSDSMLVWLKLIFKKELKYKVCNQLIQFKKQLIQHEFTSCIELYEAYIRLKEELLLLHNGGLQWIPNTLPYRIWNFIKKGMKQVKYILLYLILAAAIALSVLVFQKNVQKNNEITQVVEYIGTVKIGGEE